MGRTALLLVVDTEAMSARRAHSSFPTTLQPSLHAHVHPPPAPALVRRCPAWLPCTDVFSERAASPRLCPFPPRAPGTMLRLLNRQDPTVKAWQDLAINVALFSLAVWAAHKYGHKLAV